MTYRAPVDDLLFQLRHVAGFDDVAGLPGYDEGTAELAEPILTEAGRLADEVLAPLNAFGDRTGAHMADGRVIMPDGFDAGRRAFADGGWAALALPEDAGGQGLPWSLAFAVQELWQSANIAFGNCFLLSQGAMELLNHHGTADQRARYLAPLAAGAWTGTMCLTEAQAGTDVGAIRTKAEPDGGGYRLTGTKIYITFGDHALAENILHLVLARLPDAPAGTKGLSLFVVPKRLVGADGSLGDHNDVRCLSLEHKLGQHASPTCVMSFGEAHGAWAELVGAPHDGMRCMFTMMNNARLSVGIQGLGIAERAFQQAQAFAEGRIQGHRNGAPAPILDHPDVRRMLITMQSQIEAMRGLVLTAGAAIDHAAHDPDGEVRQRMAGRADLLTPIVKAWFTDLGVELTSLAIQVHGGMGYIEETGAAQHYRDGRVPPIYEGTNGIQAIDLAGRKLHLANGELPWQLFEELRQELRALEQDDGGPLVAPLRAALANCEAATRWLQGDHGRDEDAILAGASPYLRMMAQTLGGFVLVRGARAAAATGHPSAAGKAHRARFYVEQLLPPATALLPAVIAGSTSLEGAVS
ncbi:MAG: acyl-CoA dehydrogenase [Pseudomonadota bacterium]